MTQDAPKMAQDGPKWPQDGPKMTQDGPKMAQTIFRLPFLIDFWSISSPNLGPKIDQNRPKNDAKMHSIFDPIV